MEPKAYQALLGVQVFSDVPHDARTVAEVTSKLVAVTRDLHALQHAHTIYP